ncbi:hypothetical protein Golob_024914 [Gossypium lobatum]|uniref:Uncharacterized protein n=1 Tax=Gossypium lobatum TaxID=34289 RepID=A0A7J8NFM2_9ROSI|nr:hypothetical protein [Gossypium lobatum]
MFIYSGQRSNFEDIHKQLKRRCTEAIHEYVRDADFLYAAHML